MLEITSDPSRELKWYFRINRDNKRTFRFFDSVGDPFDFTGYTVVVNFKNREGDSTNFLQLTTSAGLTITTNDVAVSLSKAQAANFRDQTYFIEWVVTNSGYERDWFTGDAVFHNGKFDGVGSSSTDVTIQDGENVVNVTISDSSASLTGVPQKQGIWTADAFPTTSGVDEDGTEIKDGYFWLITNPDGCTIGGVYFSYLSFLWSNSDSPTSDFTETGWRLPF